MPFAIRITINKREVVLVRGCNCGPPWGDRETCPTRIYRYVADHPESGKQTEGGIIHVRAEGIEKLAGLILLDLAAKAQNR